MFWAVALDVSLLAMVLGSIDQKEVQTQKVLLPDKPAAASVLANTHAGTVVHEVPAVAQPVAQPQPQPQAQPQSQPQSQSQAQPQSQPQPQAPAIIRGPLVGQVGLNSFDGIIYINLEKRKDRRDSFEKHMQDYGVDPAKLHRVAAVPTPELGAKGCSASHAQALAKAIESGWQNVLVFEDDFRFNVGKDEVNRRFSQFFNSVNQCDWDIAMLTANIHKTVSSGYPGVLSVHEALAASGLAINKRFMQKLHDMYQKSYEEQGDPICIERHRDPKWHCDRVEPWNPACKACRPLDVMWLPFQKESKWFVFSPTIGYQLPGLSDIEGRKVNYKNVGA